MIQVLWGKGVQLDLLQMASRGFVVFLVAYILLRLGGKRIFGKKSAFDYVIIIVMGSVLARVIVGASPFFPSVAASLVMILLNRVFCYICAVSPTWNKRLNGSPVVLYEKDHVLWDNLRKVSLSIDELTESLHLETRMENFRQVERAYMENNGRISFTLKEE